MKPQLAILISTIDGGIDRIPEMMLPDADDIVWIISHQFTEPRLKTIPAALASRTDVIISHIPGRGVARSRNNALDICPPGIACALFADDDGHYRREYFDSVIRTFRDYPNTDAACFMIESLPGEPNFTSGHYTTITTIKSTYDISVGTPGLAVRPDVIKSEGIRFDERFGAGAGFIQFADENVFLHDCLKSGLTVTFFPVPVVKMHYENTIKKMGLYDPRRTRSLGAMDARCRGFITAYLKAIWFSFAYRNKILAAGYSPFQYYRDRISGIRYLRKTTITLV